MGTHSRKNRVPKIQEHIMKHYDTLKYHVQCCFVQDVLNTTISSLAQMEDLDYQIQ